MYSVISYKGSYLLNRHAKNSLFMRALVPFAISETKLNDWVIHSEFADDKMCFLCHTRRERRLAMAHSGVTREVVVLILKHN